MRVFSDLHVPISEIEKMLPAVMAAQTKIHLDKRTPLGPFRFPDEV